MKLRLLLVLFLLAGAGVAAALFSLSSAYAGFKGETFVDIPMGTSTRQVARLLADAGVVRYRWQFLLVRALCPKAKLQAGEYYFHEAASVRQVFDRIVQGDIFYHELTVPEGHSLFDVAALLEKLGLIPAEDFLRAARDPSEIRDLAPEAPTLEGYLFPDTYRITRLTTASQLCRQMTQRFREAWEQMGGSAAVHATVTMASLIEKETGLDEERPLVASVFNNRLEIGMPLECDPTAIYAALLENRYRGILYRSDLQSDSRYNTYRHRGLPPGPIANPGIQSLRAALNPADTSYLFFVARPDGSGAHEFSRKFEAHQRAVQRYRRGNPKTEQKSTPEPVSRSGSAGTHH